MTKEQKLVIPEVIYKSPSIWKVLGDFMPLRSTKPVNLKRLNGRTTLNKHWGFSDESHKNSSNVCLGRLCLVSFCTKRTTCQGLTSSCSTGRRTPKTRVWRVLTRKKKKKQKNTHTEKKQTGKTTTQRQILPEIRITTSRQITRIHVLPTLMSLSTTRSISSKCVRNIPTTYTQVTIT